MKSEQVAGFILECMAGFVGIRMQGRRVEDRAGIHTVLLGDADG